MCHFSELFCVEELELVESDVPTLNGVIAIDVPEHKNGVAARLEINTTTTAGFCFFTVLDEEGRLEPINMGRIMS
jgi:hypothetical protein